jgi:D-3-phosphoglycerate dehydrogenase / 2-oxoglutarate reductase
MAQFKIVTPAGASFTVAGGGYDHEMEALEGMGAEIVECPATEDGFIAAARDADAVYAKGMPLTRRMIDALERCRLIALGTVGVDYVDVAAATAKGIPVTNCPDTFIEEVADHAMMLLLAAHRRALEQDRMVREGRWREGRPQLLPIPRLQGQTLGFIGFGRVARATARRAAPFGLRMIAFDPYLEELLMTPYGVHPASLSELLANSDFISMHLPDTPESRGFLQEKHFRQMKRNALFINTGRGPTVVESALIRALQEGWIAGAGLDVFEVEPLPADSPLRALDNVLLAPHLAGTSVASAVKNRQHAIDQVEEALRDGKPSALVNKGVQPRLVRA